jgi:hypothetical protein
MPRQVRIQLSSAFDHVIPCSHENAPPLPPHRHAVFLPHFPLVNRRNRRHSDFIISPPLHYSITPNAPLLNAPQGSVARSSAPDRAPASGLRNTRIGISQEEAKATGSTRRARCSVPSRNLWRRPLCKCLQPCRLTRRAPFGWQCISPLPLGRWIWRFHSSRRAVSSWSSSSSCTDPTIRPAIAQGPLRLINPAPGIMEEWKNGRMITKIA